MNKNTMVVCATIVMCMLVIFGSISYNQYLNRKIDIAAVEAGLEQKNISIGCSKQVIWVKNDEINYE